MSTPAPAPVIVIAAGGTGGHVFPGLAVAEALRAAADVRVVFFGTPRGLEKDLVPRHGWELELLEAAPLKGQKPAKAAAGAVVAARETARAAMRLRKLGPKAVLSVGGYAAGPVALAAALLRVPVAILEPNRIAGLANRALARLAREAYVAWPETGVELGGQARVLGVPLRTAFRPKAPAARARPRVLVMGGSQGAAALNERLPHALALVARAMPSLEVVHQTGHDKAVDVRSAYEREGLAATVVPFLEDVAGELAAADLVVARAGAVTLAEISAVGRPSILIPYPFAADDHQARNAEALAAAGGALSVRQEAADSVRLAREIGLLLSDDALRIRMADVARAHGRPDAAREVALALLGLAGVPPGPTHRAPPAGPSSGASGKMNGKTNGSHHGPRWS